MKNRRFVLILSAFLAVVLMCGLIPTACADYGKPAGMCPAYGGACPGQGNMCQGRECAGGPCSARETFVVENGLKEARVEMLINIMACAYAAEEEQDPAVQTALLEQTNALWNEYMDLVFASCEAGEPVVEISAADQFKEARVEMLMNIMACAYAAEEEQDPAAQTALLEQTNALWNEYMDLVLVSCEAEKPVVEKTAAEQLKEARVNMLMKIQTCAYAAEEEQDPAAQAALLEQTKALWNEYMDLVLASCEAEEPVVEKTAADQLKEARVDMLMKIQTYAYAAEEEQDPAAQTALLEQTNALWNEYMDLVLASCEAEEPVVEKTAAEQLKEARVNMLMKIQTYAYAAEEEQDPAAQAALLEQTNALWNEYMDLVLASCAVETAAEADRDIYLDDTQEPDWDYMDPYADPVTETTEQMPVIGMPNPWTVTESLDEASSISGVSLKLPAEDALPAGMELTFFRAMPGTIEADYSNGTDELIIRASLDEEGYYLAGDYNTYSREWKDRVNGMNVRCLGDGKRANVAVYDAGDLAYALSMACGKEGAGLSRDALAGLLTSMQTNPKAGRHGKNMPAPAERDIYADPQTQPAPAMAEEPAEVGKNGEIMVLYTGNVCAAIDSGFGYAGLKALRDALEAEGYTVILLDTGDAVQGDAVGTVSRGEAIIDLMNALDYDFAIPGVHEFDFGMDQFVNLMNAADFPYISCSFADDELAFPLCAMVEADGINIAFVGVTDGAQFTDAEESAWGAVQEAIDIAREAGADLVYLAGNMSEDEGVELIAHTVGADAFLGAHTAGQQLVPDEDGKPVFLTGCGGQLNGIGFSRVSADGRIMEIGVWTWPNNRSAQLLFGIDNDVSEMATAIRQKVDEELNAAMTWPDAAFSDQLCGVICEGFAGPCGQGCNWIDEPAAEGTQTPELGDMFEPLQEPDGRAVRFF